MTFEFDSIDLCGISYSLSVNDPPSASLSLDLPLILTHTYMHTLETRVFGQGGGCWLSDVGVSFTGFY